MTYQEFEEHRKQMSVRNRKPIEHREDDLQIYCVGWFREHYPELSPLLFHPNNEAYFGHGKTPEQRARAGKHAKDMGVTPGVADLILLYPASGYHGLMIEMKDRTKGRQSKSQEDWENVVKSHGYQYVICNTRMGFKEIIRRYTMIEPLNHEQVAAEKLFGKNVNVHCVKK